MSRSKHIVIVGCGRLGSTLANQLSAAGHRLVVIDHNEYTFDHLAAEYSGFRIAGDAVELHVLQQAKIEQADYLFAMTTQDNVNLMVAQVARMTFNVPHVVARVFDIKRERVYNELGVRTISPTRLAATAFMGFLAESESEANKR